MTEEQKRAIDEIELSELAEKYDKMSADEIAKSGDFLTKEELLSRFNKESGE